MTTLADRIADHYDELMAYSMQLTKDVTRAEDLVQSSMLRALRYADRYEEKGYLRAWLYRIAWSQHMGNMGKLNVRWKTPEHHVRHGAHGSEWVKSVEASVAAASKATEIVETLRRDLSDNHFQILMLRADDKTYQEIADEAGILVGTVMSRLGRARKAAKQALAGDTPETVAAVIGTAPDGSTHKAESQVALARAHNLSKRKISECLRGNQKTHKGWTFEEVVA